MKPADITRHLEQATGDLGALAATQGRARPTPIDGRLVLEHHPRLAWTMHDVDQWAQQGHPSGGGGGVRGGDSTPLPERLALVGKGDTFAADLLEAEVTLRQVTDGLRWLRAFTARNHWAGEDLNDPRRKPPPETATCRGCNRTIAANAIDPCLAGYCTSSKDRPNGGCHADWLDDRREKDRVRQAEWRARQRGRDIAEDCEGVTHG